MRNTPNWLALAACIAFGLVATAPVEAAVQTKKSKTQTSKKVKKPVKRAAKSAAKPKAKTYVPKAHVVNKGSFRTLKNSDRITVITRGSTSSPRPRSDIEAARRRSQVTTLRTVAPSQAVLRNLTVDTYPSTALLVRNPNTSWWGTYGPPSTSYLDPTYGWITTIGYSWGTVMYTYGYQVVNFWNGGGYDWVAYPGVAGVAYPVLYR
ncbi:MAG: hypothetical protein JST30_01990 [Armatimonadetes bacterium]|nr:hypothetical protein [Armatimonadota bacterium]